MKAFIKAAEVWIPDDSGTRLKLGTSFYGDLGDFESISKSMTFEFGEGLPGGAWQQRRPLVWNDLKNDQFKRRNFISDTGIASGIAIPVFSGEFLLAVAVLFCGHGDDVHGVVEVWYNNTINPHNELRMTDGYYGGLERFSWISRKLTIMKGHGLPGQAWAMNKPLIMADLGQSGSFLRAQNAREAGITTGVALPFSATTDETQVVNFLSVRGTPLARIFEIWVPDAANVSLRFDAGYSCDNTDLQKLHEAERYIRGEGELGKVWMTGHPRISQTDNGETSIAIPVISLGVLTGIARFQL